jgi:hypothetical protein
MWTSRVGSPALREIQTINANANTANVVANALPFSLVSPKASFKLQVAA